MTLRIAVIGAGPGGLYFAALARLLNREHEITIWERNAPDDTFGFGVVLSEQALAGIERADPVVLSHMRPLLTQWDDINVHYRGTTSTAGGNSFAAMIRTGLLTILQRRCAQLGVQVHFSSELTDVDALAADYDLVVAADGANSGVRARYAGSFRPEVHTGRSRYIWLGSDLELDAFKFYTLDTPGGAMQVHAYPDSRRASTFILELSEDAWRWAGFADVDAPQLGLGESDTRSIGIIAELCKDILAGHKLFGNNSRWLRFPTVRCETWRHRNVVLIGDAAHTAHFSIGSGTKLAMEDALALATSLHEQPGVDAALAAYEAERAPAVTSIQRAAQTSLKWFENIDHYTHQEPQQFAVNLLTRSGRVSYPSLRKRDPRFIAEAENWFAGATDGPALPPMCQPFTLGHLKLVNRVVSAPAQASTAGDGVPGDHHLVSLGAAALGGGGLVLTGPVAATPTSAMPAGGAGLCTGDQEAGWQRVVDFVHGHSPAKIGVRLGCYGPGCSANPLSELRREFAAAARRAATAGFDLLEFDCVRDCRLGSSLHDALEVLGAMRASWPGDRPVSVRVTPARQPADGSREGADAAIEFANALAASGASAVHAVTATKTDPAGFADLIRNQAGREFAVTVIAEGLISADDVNTIVLAGHADLCVVDQLDEPPLWLSQRGVPNRSSL